MAGTPCPRPGGVETRSSSTSICPSPLRPSETSGNGGGVGVMGEIGEGDGEST